MDISVYRIESRHGYGAYTARLDVFYYEHAAGHIEEDTRPCAGHRPPPCDDSGLRQEMHKITERFHGQNRYGFESLDALVNWFPSEVGRKAMQNGGALLSVYETFRDSTLFGARQLVFDISKANKIASLDLQDFTTVTFDGPSNP